MKLRQKLAVVLASAMVITAVPVVTMAKSTAGVTNTIKVANEEMLADKAPNLKITLEDEITTDVQFYLELAGSEFVEKDEDGNKLDIVATVNDSTAGITVERTSATEATVKLAKGFGKDDVVLINLGSVKVTGEGTIAIDGNETVVSSMDATLFATKLDAKATVTVADPTSFYTTTTNGATLGDIVITESVDKTIVAGETVKIELDHDDFEFLVGQDDKGTFTLKGSKGFSGIKETTVEYKKASNLDKDDDVVEIEFKLPSSFASKGKGVFTISGLKVRSLTKTPDLGDLEVSIIGGDSKIEDKTVVAATVVDYGTEFTVAEKKEVKAGKKETVKLTYKETTADSIAKCDVDFVLDKGTFSKIADNDVTKITEDAILKAIDAKGEKVSGLEFIFEKDHKDELDHIIGFTLTCVPNGKEATEFIKDLEVEVSTKLDTEGEVTITTSGRYIEDQEAVVANVTSNLKISTEAMVLKVGQTKQVGGKVVISELEKGAFEKNSTIVLTLADDKGIEFTEAPKVTVDGTAQVDSKLDGKQIIIELDRASKDEPSTITVEGFEVSVDRTVPQGSYELKFGFLDESPYAGTLSTADFFVVGTPNEEELAANGLPKGTAAFTIGSTEYTVNGTTKVMDGAAYAEPGYTMVPVRYVAEALGVSVQDILFSNSTVTIFAGSRTIQLTLGSNVAMVNGAPIHMATKVVAKDGRTYAPMGEIARILGVETSWDGATQTASFINK